MDAQVGRVIDEVEALGYGDNTLIFYIWGDNGSSAEGQNGTISELLAQNGIPTTVEQHIAALDALGGLDVLGSPKTDNQYHAGWAWAGSTPYKGTKLLASHFGGTRNPMAVRWPAKIKPDATPRTQFHHCNDIVPTIYEILGITPPRTVNGVPQDPIDGVSFAYSFDDPKAEGRLLTQYFEIMGSRAIYHDGWMACAIGPRLPWVPGAAARHPRVDARQGRLGALQPRRGLDAGQRPGGQDAGEARAAEGAVPDRGSQEQSAPDRRRPLGSRTPSRNAAWPRPIPSGTSPATSDRMPEFCAPALGNKPNLVTIDADIPAECQRRALQAGREFSGGLTCSSRTAILCYEYNLFIILRTKITRHGEAPRRQGEDRDRNSLRRAQAGGPLKVTLTVNGQSFATGAVPVSAPLLFTANDCLDIGIALGSPRVTRLLRKGAVQVHWHDQQGERPLYSTTAGSRRG